MPTKDPHIALIDAHEKLEQIKLWVRQATNRIKNNAVEGLMPTEEDKLMIAAIRAEAIERTKQIQDDLLEEIESHGKLS